MSGSAGINDRRTAIFLVAFRALLAGLLLVHATPQLVAFWQASQIISPGGSPDAVMLANVAVPMAIFMGAVMIAVGFKTRLMAVAMIVMLATATVFDLVLFGSPSSTLDWMARLSVMLALVSLFLLGAGRLSIDGLLASRIAAHAAQ